MDIIEAPPVANPAADSPKMIELLTIDSVKIKVDKRIINMSRVLRDAVEAEDCDEEECPVVPCFEVHSDQLKLIIQYCEHF